MTPNFSLCVYCGSRPGADPHYAQAARDVGAWIGRHGGQLVYGGGQNGLMGIVADATTAAGGSVVGIIPQFMVEREWARPSCDELHIVSTMHERKQMMVDRADAFVALPGGIGTFEEFFEAWTWRQLGYHNKPVGLLNLGGYYNDLLKFLLSSVSQGFMQQNHLQLITHHTSVSPLLSTLIESAGFSTAAFSREL
ncbi:MAG: TIGR00730 family Rossman fold protein [Burkholderiaceae bacterium]